MIAKIKEKIQYYIRVRILHEDPMKIKIEKGRSSGIKIGECCHIYSELPRRNDACLLEIGDNVTISGGYLSLCMIMQSADLHIMSIPT